MKPYGMRIVALTYVLSWLSSLSAWGGDLVITSFTSNGELTWACPTNDVLDYRVEWASAATGPWTDTWANLRGMLPTGETMRVAVPMFYRVVGLADADYLVIDISAGPMASNYVVSSLSSIPEGGWTDVYKTTKLVLRRIPAGTFIMGSPTDELGRDTDETQHQVTMTQPFYIGLFEVTQKQWERVMGTWPSYFNNASYRDSRPVELVNYTTIRGSSAGAGWPANSSVDPDSFMGRLRARTGRAFDLPTESQWEYAGRAGTTTALNSGKNLTDHYECPNMSAVGRYWYTGGSAYTQNGGTSVATAKVGTYLPNAWGLYDIHGNVWEWCLDWYGSYPGTVSDPRGATTGSYRVFRGGGWNDYSDSCRVGDRGGDSPDLTYMIVGFRACVPAGK